MADHRRRRRRHHHHISSLNLPWCFGPSPTKDTPKRATRNDTTSCTTTSSSSSSHSKQKRLFRFGSMSIALTSPRIGCMGQIKRGKPSSRTSSSSTTSSSESSSSSSSSPSRRSKFLKSTMAPLTRSSSASAPVSPRVGVDDHSTVLGVSISVADMDPPLPVVRRAARDEHSVSLWERRCGGNEPMGLQLPQ